MFCLAISIAPPFVGAWEFFEARFSEQNESEKFEAKNILLNDWLGRPFLGDEVFMFKFG